MNVDDESMIAEALGKLYALGSPDQMAVYLEAEQITGRPGMTYSCPVAKYLTRETGQAMSAGAMYAFPSTNTDHAMVKMPRMVREFIARFDARSYPRLIEEA